MVTRHVDRRLPAFPGRERLPAEKIAVSIVIVNHNYQRFLGEAIESALAQEDAEAEVIVVDDGSSDDSRAFLAGYGTRVRVLLQPNLGQSAAFNAGFAAAGGDVIFYLDADDFLHPQIVARVMAAFRRAPAAARVVFRLALVDEAGRPTGELTPPADVTLPVGDVRRQILAYGDDLAWPPTSGNAFARWALRWVMPLPVTADLTGGDFWLHPTMPLLGPVLTLDMIGGAYRAHGHNYAFRPGVDVKRSRQIISRASRVHPRLRELARDLGYGDCQPHSVTLAAHRMVSLRLGGSGHPVPGDTRLRIVHDGILAAWYRGDLRLSRRLLYVVWFVVAGAAPRVALRPIAELFFTPSKRHPYLRRLLRPSTSP